MPVGGWMRWWWWWWRWWAMMTAVQHYKRIGHCCGTAWCLSFYYLPFGIPSVPGTIAVCTLPFFGGAALWVVALVKHGVCDVGHRHRFHSTHHFHFQLLCFTRPGAKRSHWWTKDMHKNWSSMFFISLGSFVAALFKSIKSFKNCLACIRRCFRPFATHKTTSN